MPMLLTGKSLNMNDHQKSWQSVGHADLRICVFKKRDMPETLERQKTGMIPNLAEWKRALIKRGQISCEGDNLVMTH